MTGPDSPRDLLIVGAGGFARETAQAVAAVNAVRPTWRLLGFLDDDPALTGKQIDGVGILGGSDLVHKHPQAHVVVCVGSPRGLYSRALVVHRLGLPAERYATVVHPTAVISRDSVVGPGTVLLAHTVLTAAVTVGSHIAVMPQAVLTHDCVLEDYVTIASGVRLGGTCRLERGVYLGAGAVIREMVTIGSWSLVGMGSVVLRDVPASEAWVGNPATLLRVIPVPDPVAAELARPPAQTPAGSGTQTFTQPAGADLTPTGRPAPRDAGAGRPAAAERSELR